MQRKRRPMREYVFDAIERLLSGIPVWVQLCFFFAWLGYITNSILKILIKVDKLKKDRRKNE